MASEVENIDEVLMTTPELNKYPMEMWNKAHEFLRLEGFDSKKFTYIITQNPKLLSTPHEKLLQSLSHWRGYLGDRQTLKLLEKNPELLNVEHTREFQRKVTIIEEFLGNNVSKILLSCPSVILQSASSLTSKIDYLSKVMGVEPVEVYKSEALTCDLNTIKERHIFLERLGLFLKKKKTDESEISKNPKLYQITDSSDKRFAKLCFVTLEEYETFQELYKREQEKEKSEKTEDDEEDDEDEEVK